jgi:hypothetical protein
MPEHTRRKSVWARDIYRMAYRRAQGAANQQGHTRLSPSIAERRDYDYAWRDFMAGWRDGMRDWSRDSVSE